MSESNSNCLYIEEKKNMDQYELARRRLKMWINQAVDLLASMDTAMRAVPMLIEAPPPAFLYPERSGPLTTRPRPENIMQEPSAHGASARPPTPGRPLTTRPRPENVMQEPSAHEASARPPTPGRRLLSEFPKKADSVSSESSDSSSLNSSTSSSNSCISSISSSSSSLMSHKDEKTSGRKRQIEDQANSIKDEPTVDSIEEGELELIYEGPPTSAKKLRRQPGRLSLQKPD